MHGCSLHDRTLLRLSVHPLDTPPPHPSAPDVDFAESEHPESEPDDALWQQIMHMMDDLSEWRNPDLTIESLAEDLSTNKTYIQRAFTQHADTTMAAYINQRRVEYIASELRKKPN